MINAINMFKNQTDPSVPKKNGQDLNLSDDDSEETKKDLQRKEKATKKTKSKSKIVIQKKADLKKVRPTCNDDDIVLVESESEEEISKPTTSRTLRKRKSNDTLCKKLSSPESETDEDDTKSKNKLIKK
jgi:hypothetical protein